MLTNTSREKVLELGNELRNQFHTTTSQTFITPQAVTLSIGVNLFEHPPASLAALIEQGDAALYTSKREGRDSIRVVDQSLSSIDTPQTR